MIRYWLMVFLAAFMGCKGTDSSAVVTASFQSNVEIEKKITVPGADQLPLYIPKLKDKRVALVANKASMIGSTHLIDTLLQLNIHVHQIMVPEHGFRADADAGAHIKDGKDQETGIPIVSLYGKNKKPSPDQLESTDVVVFDLQDVGVRCYTYISTLHYVMEACAEEGIPVIVLDRPNPNGHYVDGPILEKEKSSFVGMHQVPLVYGMTIGEYAQMIKGENWIASADKLDLQVVPCHGYDHSTRYPLPIPPSPNLPSYKSILLYPSLVLFEGTVISVGRGTDLPFEVYGHPEWRYQSFAFTPKSKPGASAPKHQDRVCGGYYLGQQDDYLIRKEGQINLEPLLRAYEIHREMKVSTPFFLENNFFDKLAGTSSLKDQVLSGASEEEIRASWEAGLQTFEKVRAKYLLYEAG